MENDIEKVKQKHPSICYTCINARKPASDENTKKGYVGCCIRVMQQPTKDHREIYDGKEIAEGWVDLKSEIKFGKGSGMTTNFQLLTLEINGCSQYSEK